MLRPVGEREELAAAFSRRRNDRGVVVGLVEEALQNRRAGRQCAAGSEIRTLARLRYCRLLLMQFSVLHVVLFQNERERHIAGLNMLPRLGESRSPSCWLDRTSVEHGRGVSVGLIHGARKRTKKKIIN